MNFRFSVRLRTATIAAATALSLLTSGLAAPAASAVTIGDTVEKASGTADLATDTTSDAANAAIVNTAENGSVSIPRIAESGVQFTAGDALTDFILVLPASGNSTATANGTQLYAGSAPGFSTAVQPIVDGARALVHINEKGSPLAYRFPIQLPPGGELVPSVDDNGVSDGGVDVTVTTQVGDGLGEATGVIAHIEQPWAKDAGGMPFPAYYGIEGNTLVLNVRDDKNVCGRTGCKPVNAQYPLVADPAVKRNCGIVTCSFYFSRTTTKNLKDSLSAGTGLSGAAGLAICTRIPHPMGLATCLAVLVAIGLPVIYNINGASNRKPPGCFVVRINMARWFLAGNPISGLVRALVFSNVAASNKYCRR